VAFHVRRSEQAEGVSVIFTGTVAPREMSVARDSTVMAANEAEIGIPSGASIDTEVN
jgi:hypothetical protein